MFFESTILNQPALNRLEVDALLKPYQRLNSALIKGTDDGLACRFKFSNNGMGISMATRMKIENLALAIINDEIEISSTDLIAHIDLFILFANHIDQHTNDSINQKLARTEKERLVLLFLDAAFKLNNKIAQDELSLANARLLSSQVLLFHYLGKAERYSKDVARQSSENRMLKLDKALTIAQFLSENDLSEELHPHNYAGLLSTCRLVKGYCLTDLGRFNEALALQQYDIEHGNNFHKTQALKESCKIITLQLKNSISSADIKVELEAKLLSYAHQAIAVSLEQNSTVVMRNAENALMHACDVVGNGDLALELANKMLELETDKESGVKDYHLNEARMMIEKYGCGATSSMSV